MSDKRRNRRNLKQMFGLEVSEEKRKGPSSRLATSKSTPTGGRATITETPRPYHPEQSRSASVGSSRSGSARRKSPPEYNWLRRTLKYHTALYITRALEERGMSRAELAERVGVSLGRINQLLSVRGFGEFERVPLDLIYQIWNITEVQPTFLIHRFVPPKHVGDKPPPMH